MISSKLELFTKYPDNYILQMDVSTSKKELTILKKGLWTWLKIHVGSLIGLFDKSTVQLREVAKFVSTHRNQINNNVCLALDNKIAFRNLKHTSNTKTIKKRIFQI